MRKLKEIELFSCTCPDTTIYRQRSRVPPRVHRTIAPTLIYVEPRKTSFLYDQIRSANLLISAIYDITRENENDRCIFNRSWQKKMDDLRVVDPIRVEMERIKEGSIF